MSPQPTAETTPTPEPSPGQQRAQQRLADLRRSLQRQLRRKPTRLEKQALDQCALLTLRAEIAAADPKASSNDIVRLSNIARRARADWDRIANPPKTNGATLGDILRQGMRA